MLAIPREEHAAVVALVRRGDRSWHEYAQLVEARGSALAVLAGDFDEHGDGMQEETLFDPSPPQEPIDLGAILEEIEAWESNGASFTTVLDPTYPSNLRSIHNRPPFLFVHGDLAPDDYRSIAIVGTRRASTEGLTEARRVAHRACELGYTVVSGLAAGIDTAAHTAALDSGARTVAVIGTGVNRHYPRENRNLQERISEHGAVLSQFWPDSPPTRYSFPMRNAVMSGTALATVVVEASGKSGARMQARLALEHGRPVFLLRSLLSEEWARNYAARPGTTVIDDPDDIFERLDRLEAETPMFA